MVASIIMYSLSGSLANSLKIRSQTPLFAHRLNRFSNHRNAPEGRAKECQFGTGKNGLHKQPIVGRRATHMSFSAGQKILDPIPLVIA